MARIEVRIAGFGGQGVVLAGVLLGRAAVLYDGKKAVQTQSYGSEARGGAARSEVVLSDRQITYPAVLNADILVSMSQPTLDKYLPDLKPGGILITDSDLVKTIPKDAGFRVYREPFSDIAVRELGSQIAANMVVLGFMVGLTGIVSLQAIRESVRTGVPRGSEERNLKALEAGLRLAGFSQVGEDRQ